MDLLPTMPTPTHFWSREKRVSLKLQTGPPLVSLQFVAHITFSRTQ
jgi:hypothetical protein